MSDTTTINFDTQLRGLPVLNPGTAYKLGNVTDLAIDPTHGTVSGLFLLTPEEEEIFLPVAEGIAYEGAYFLSQRKESCSATTRPSEALRDHQEILPALLRVTTDLLGASVVTEGGRLLGNIRTVYLDPTNWQVSYQVAVSWWQRWQGGGMRLAAHLPVRWSQTAGRLIVPDEVGGKQSVRSQAKDIAAH